VLFLEKCGFQRVILARELSLVEIASIRARTTVPLEAFVHGALCVSCSGQCYMSFAIGGRSANRGVCAQPCRKKYKLVDAQDKVIAEDYLLSLKDLNLSDSLEQLIDAGVTSFKIEGRLKDRTYVMNVVAYYRQKLDEILTKNNLQRTSQGQTTVLFTPDPAKSFNRGFTTYNITGTREDLVAKTSKSVGEKIGTITQLHNQWALIPGHTLHTGDGICYFINGELMGTQIVAVDGDAVELNILDDVTEGTVVYRNFDRLFEKQLTDKAISRKVPLTFTYADGLCTYTDPTGISVSLTIVGEVPQNRGKAQTTIIEQFSKLGDTEFIIAATEFKGNPMFIPIKQLNQLRRELIVQLQKLREEKYPRQKIQIAKTTHAYPQLKLDYHGNVSNAQAKAFYERHGVTEIAPAAESVGYLSCGDVIMTTKYCVRDQLGLCLHTEQGKVQPEPLFLVDDRGAKFGLHFHCTECGMQITKE
jgi:putative protease